MVEGVQTSASACDEREASTQTPLPPRYARSPSPVFTGEEAAPHRGSKLDPLTYPRRIPIGRYFGGAS